MKEHTNLNTLAGHNSLVDVSIYTADGLFDSSIKTQNGLDASFSDMDLINVKENLDFIKEQSAQPEGSSLMSRAHYSLSLSRVMELFG